MTFDENIWNYKMNTQDEALAEFAKTIIVAYNGSYKPHLIQGNFPTGYPTAYRFKHSPKGFSLIKDDQQDGIGFLTTDENLSDFAEHAFLVLIGSANIKWQQITESKAVQQTLQRKYGSDTLKVMYPCQHPKYKGCIVCSEQTYGRWVDGYYNFDYDGNLTRIEEAK